MSNLNKEMQQEEKEKKIPHWKSFIVLTILYLLFLYWVGSWRGLILVPLLFDKYITHFIHWSSWRDIKNPIVRFLMSWIDAIVFAVIALYFVNTYLFQNYQIPSSSLEKTMLVGDYLYVSKISYGARKPMTPIHLPFVQNTLPFFNCNSYLSWPKWKYDRTKGLGKVERNDIVVFNFPAGDSVAVNRAMTDIYSLSYSIGEDAYPVPARFDTLDAYSQALYFDKAYRAGRKVIDNSPNIYGKVVYRPVDRRENYVKRCVGIPGDTLEIKKGIIYIDGVAEKTPEGVQMNYFVQTQGMRIPQSIFRSLGISKDDEMMMSTSNGWDMALQKLGLTKMDSNGIMAPVYHLPLTKKMLQTLEGNKALVSHIVMEPEEFAGDLYPLNMVKKWDRNNYGPIWVPKKGSTIALTLENLPIYSRCIEAYEGHQLALKADGIYIDGQLADHYTFAMDYYWMMGDNRHNSADSRYWGFVPEDHIVGKPIVVWLSLDKDRSWFDGHIRFNRFFKWVN